jgi:hypothetical protein
MIRLGAARVANGLIRATSLTFIILITTMLLAACAGGSVTYRYRLTVEVHTPEGLKTGSSVIEVRTSPSGPLHPGLASRARGQAVVVDLGRRGILFALLSPDSFPGGVSGIAPDTLQPGYVSKQGSAEDWLDRVRALKKVQGRAAVPAASYPMLVRFRVPKNPLTVEEVDPDNISQAFGSGVDLSEFLRKLLTTPFCLVLEKFFLG